MKMKCETTKLNWCTAYSYTEKESRKSVDTTLSFETMQRLCEKHGLDPSLGAHEASYAAFVDWVGRHRGTREKFSDKDGFDIVSLVDLFNDDLKNTATVAEWENQRK